MRVFLRRVPPRLQVRISILRLMLLVALVAVALATAQSRRYGGRRDYYLRRAQIYGMRATEFLAKADEAKQKAAEFLRQADQLDGEPAQKHRAWADDQLLRASLYRRVAEFDAGQERKFRAAAERPWEPPPSESLAPPLPPSERSSE